MSSAALAASIAGLQLGGGAGGGGAKDVNSVHINDLINSRGQQGKVGQQIPSLVIYPGEKSLYMEGRGRGRGRGWVNYLMDVVSI